MQLRVAYLIATLSIVTSASIATAQESATTDTVATATVATETVATEPLVDPDQPTGTIIDETTSTADAWDDEPSTATIYEESWDDDGSTDDGSGVAACLTCGAVTLGLPVILLIVSIVIAVWVHRDARSRNDPNAVVWAILGFLLNVIGLIIYLIARKDRVEPPTAPPPQA